MEKRRWLGVELCVLLEAAVVKFQKVSIEFHYQAMCALFAEVLIFLPCPADLTLLRPAYSLMVSFFYDSSG